MQFDAAEDLAVYNQRQLRIPFVEFTFLGIGSAPIRMKRFVDPWQMQIESYLVQFMLVRKLA